MLEVKINNASKHPLPEYATPQSAGLDLRANLQAPAWLLPGDRMLIRTGLYLELPEGYEAQIRPRSGLALRHGVTIANGIGTIDADYRGEIGVILINLSDQPFEINDGDRIAQMVINQVTRITWLRVAELSATARGNGGFGSTGK